MTDGIPRIKVQAVVTHNGRAYGTRGYLNGIQAPVGTVLGPNMAGENLTVVECDETRNRVRVAHSRPEDFNEIPLDVRSVREHHIIRGFGLRR